MDRGGVHGDEGGDLVVTPGGALDDVGGPGGVVETVTAVRTLHPTVAPEEVATHAEAGNNYINISEKRED